MLNYSYHSKDSSTKILKIKRLFAPLNLHYALPISSLSNSADPVQGLIFCILVLFLSLALSAFTYRYIEIPSRDYLNMKIFKYKNGGFAK